MTNLLALLVTLVAQDTTGLSPRALAMLDRFPPPRRGEVTLTTQFSTSTAWVGEQVELVTAAWFPRELRDRLRRPPTLRAPTIGGLWSAPTRGTPMLAASRFVDGQIYDLFVAHQILFPLAAGTINSPPAVLSYAVPTSVSFFAPEERTELSSRSATLIVRPVPDDRRLALGNGPTARGLHLAWRAPPEGLRRETPARVELVITGAGNVTLWPEPQIDWPSSVRIYQEPAEQAVDRPNGLIAGEKRFRFTVVPDSAGVITLPAISYPYFDPGTGRVITARAELLSLAVRPPTARRDRRLLPVEPEPGAAVIAAPVRRGWPVMLLLALLPFVPRLRRRLRRATTTQPAPAPPPEVELRLLLGAPEDAAPQRVARALRHRGVSAAEAREVALWLGQRDRARYGPDQAADATPPARISVILARLRRAARGVATLLLLLPSVLGAQTAEAITRYRGGDLEGAERLFAAAIVQEPLAAGRWRNLAAARWATGDDVGAAAAWLRALQLAPRNGETRAAWQQATTIPPDVRSRGPRVPLSRDEMLLLALVLWLGAGVSWYRGGRRLAIGGGAVALLLLAMATMRTLAEREPLLLVRPDAVLRVSPLATAPALQPAPAWGGATRVAGERGWSLVVLDGGARGWLPDEAFAVVGTLD